MMETGQLRRIQIEATGGHHELGALVEAINRAVIKLREDAARDLMPSGLRPDRYLHAPINLEGTIRVETEDDL